MPSVHANAAWPNSCDKFVRSTNPKPRVYGKRNVAWHSRQQQRGRPRTTRQTAYSQTTGQTAYSQTTGAYNRSQTAQMVQPSPVGQLDYRTQGSYHLPSATALPIQRSTLPMSQYPDIPPANTRKVYRYHLPGYGGYVPSEKGCVQCLRERALPPTAVPMMYQ